MALSQEEINHIQSVASIVDVISSYINLEKKGKNYFGLCPFHDAGVGIICREQWLCDDPPEFLTGFRRCAGSSAWSRAQAGALYRVFRDRRHAYQLCLFV